MKTVLVVEDSRAAFEILRHELAADGRYSAEYYCHNGENLLELYEQHHPDIVAMDIIMPEANGIDLTRALVQAHPEARVVMVTSMSYQEIRDSAEEAGAVGYVQKPYHPEQVISAFDQALAAGRA